AELARTNPANANSPSANSASANSAGANSTNASLVKRALTKKLLPKKSDTGIPGSLRTQHPPNQIQTQTDETAGMDARRRAGSRVVLNGGWSAAAGKPAKPDFSTSGIRSEAGELFRFV